ncbi:MAG: 4-hydroxy-tetrahydrodipicolinate synthase [Chitinivibrionales bacterium]|nr:4-hydroxy-tetrahydrodipicolinate synthase [Chitinivibrionales bacterium]MBD3356624.1 4-hydroxy-tetrahydrodipicolinate synthase [Chitinivibrionales bacterium]
MELQGCYVAMVTPFDEKGAIDEEGLRKNTEFLLENGVSGVVPCGTTGESATLSWDEHNRVVDIVLDQVKGRATVIAGAGSNSTSESIEAAAHAKDSGADAILCITPYYNKPTQEGLYQHFRAVATNVSVPMVLYNVPGRTGVNMAPETVERLCEFDAVVAVKEASGNVAQVSEIHRRCGDRLKILSGEDALTLPILSCGGKGVISVVGNILPAGMKAMIDAFFSGKVAEALKVHEEIWPVSQAMFLETNPIPVKVAMNHLGLAAGGYRLPLVPMSEDNKRRLIDVLETAGVTV